LKEDHRRQFEPLEAAQARGLRRLGFGLGEDRLKRGRLGVTALFLMSA
jgi:hypothetical protein